MIKSRPSQLSIVTTIFILITSALMLTMYKTLANPEEYDKPTRILTWWGYLSDQKKIEEIENICGTQIKVTEYFNVDELQNQASISTHDIYIYPWGYHPDIQQYLKQEGPKINGVVTNYHHAIKSQYEKAKIPKDTVYFQLAVSMFVYDKSHIPDLDDITAEDIVDFANVGKVFLMDELKQMDWLIKQYKTGTLIENWISLYQKFRARQSWNQANNAGLHFANFASDHLDENLILGNLYSGEFINPNIDWSTLSKPGKPKTLGFGVHPSLSQAASDVLAIKSYDSKDLCVAQEMASRRFLKWISEENFYFSPFEETIDSIPEQFQHLTQEFYDKADKIVWIDDALVSDPPSPEAELIWNIIKACQNDANCERWTTIGDKGLSK
jgi:hypothetical protein